jgi:hypothetical protein
VKNTQFDSDVGQILGRLNRGSADLLLESLTDELLRLHRACAALQARLSALEVTQTIQDRIAPSEKLAAVTALPKKITIDAAFSLPAEAGFHTLEYDRQGAPFRWTGPEPSFRFELMLNRTAPADLKLRYSQVFADIQDYEIPCFVDGAEIEITQVAVDGEFELHGVIPPREGGGGTVLTFVCPTPSAEEAAMSGDTRSLGLAFRWLKVAPSPDATSSPRALPPREKAGKRSATRS